MGAVIISTLPHRAALFVALFVVFILSQADAARIRTQSDRKKAEEVWTKAATPVSTAYGAPQVSVQSLATSVDHFSMVLNGVDLISCNAGSVIDMDSS